VHIKNKTTLFTEDHSLQVLSFYTDGIDVIFKNVDICKTFTLEINNQTR